MPFDYPVGSQTGDGDWVVRRFTHAEILGGNQTIAGGANFQGLTLPVAGFMAFELWLFMSAGNAGTSITAFLGQVDPENEPTMLSTNTGQMSQFAPGAVTPGVVNIWKRFTLDPVAAGFPYVPLRSVIFLQSGGFVANTTITNSRLFCSLTY